MATTHLSPEQLKELEQNVQQTLMKFPEEVVRIRYSFDQDWYGDPAINFRIVLSDRATRDDRFAQILRRVRDSLDEMELALAFARPISSMLKPHKAFSASATCTSAESSG